MMHLGLLTFPLTTHMAKGTWRNPEYPVDPAFTTPGFWQNVARRAEEGCFDFVFAADTEGIMDGYGQDRRHALMDGVNVPALDQAVLADFMAAATSNIGIVSTMSTVATPPYLMARRLASMDHMSMGRTGWNVVTTSHLAGVKGFGMTELPPGSERYDRADEFVRLCIELWNSWDADALVLDTERGLFVDPSKVHDVQFRGQWFRCDAPLNVHRSPQGGPLICQAGSSKRGVEFAGTYAELVFAIQFSKEGMKKYRDNVRAAAVAAGRREDAVKAMFAFHAFVGETREEAQAKLERQRANSNPKAALVAISGVLGVDLSVVEPNTPVREMTVPGTSGFIEAWTAGPWAAGRNAAEITIGEVAVEAALGAGARAVGTPADIADWMEEVMDYVGGDGFVYQPLYLMHDLDEFVRMVVPELQRRGLVRTDYSGKTLRDNLFAF